MFEKVRPPVMVTAEQIDIRLAEWQPKTAAAMENLLALDDTLAMKRIEGRDGFPVLSLTGVTASRVLPALVAMRDLFDQIGTLSEIVARAQRMRRSLNRLWRYSETLHEIETLLTGPSIPLPELKTPLAERNLLSASANTRTITPERLLLAMTDAFATARDAVLAVEAAWEHWEPVIDSLLNKENTLREQASALGLAAPPELDTAHQQIADLQRRVACDPLGLTANAEREAATQLSTARIALEANRRTRETTADALLAARQLLGELVQQEAAAARLFAACAEVLDAEAQPGVGAGRLRELEDWLVGLEAAAHERRWQVVDVGLQHWQETTQATLSKLAEAEKANQDLLDLPSELRGRYAVLRARMQAMNCTDDTLQRLSLQAQTVLNTSHLPVHRAVRLIEACEERLRRETLGKNHKK